MLEVDAKSHLACVFLISKRVKVSSVTYLRESKYVRRQN